MQARIVAQNPWGEEKTSSFAPKLLVAAFLAALALPTVATIDRWGYTSYLWQPSGEGPHYYNEAANYESEHKPVSFEGVYYTSGGTVKIPAATADSPYVDGAGLFPYLQSFNRGDTLTIDGSDTFWLKKYNAGEHDYVGGHAFIADFQNGNFFSFEGRNYTADNGAPEFLATNIVIEFSRAAEGEDDGATMTLKQGYLNFYDPDGVAHNSIGLKLFSTSYGANKVIYEEGTRTRIYSYDYRGSCPGELFWIKGGYHESFADFPLKSHKNSHPAYMRISGGTFDQRGGWFIISRPDMDLADTTKVQAYLTIDGTGTFAHTNNNTTYVCWSRYGANGNGSTGYLNLDDYGSAYICNLQVGAQVGSIGRLTMAGNSYLDQVASGWVTFIGRTRDSVGVFSMKDNTRAVLGQLRIGSEDGGGNGENHPHAYGELNLAGSAWLSVSNGVYMGRSVNSTGIVEIADNAFMTTLGTNMQLADGWTNGYAKVSVSGNGGLEHGHIYVANNVGTEADLVFSGSATNHVWGDNMGYVLFVGRTSNTVGRAYFKDNSTTTWGQVRIAADDNNANRIHDTAKGEMYIMDNASVTVNNHLYMGRSWNTDALLDISGGTLTFGNNCQLFGGDASNALARVNISGGLVVASNNFTVGSQQYTRGQFSMTGGKIDTNGGMFFANNTGSTASFEMTGGDIEVRGDWMAFAGGIDSTATFSMTGGTITTPQRYNADNGNWENKCNISFNNGLRSSGTYYIGGNAKIDHTYGDRIFIGRGSDTDTEVVVGGNAEIAEGRFWFGDTGATRYNSRLTVKDNAVVQWRGEHLTLGVASTNKILVTDNATFDMVGGMDWRWRNDPDCYTEVTFDGNMHLRSSNPFNVGGGTQSNICRFYLRGGSSLERCGDIDINGQDSRIEVSGGDFTFNHLYVYQSMGYEAKTNTLLVAGGRIRFDDWTVVGNNNLLGRIEVAGGEFSTREINLGFGNQAADQMCVMRVTGGKVNVEHSAVGNDAWFQLGNGPGNASRARLEQTGGEICAHSIRGNHSASGRSEAFFDGGKVTQITKVHGSYALIQDITSAEVGATGLTVDANGFAAYLNQEFTDADDGNGGTVDGVVRITGNGSVDIRKNSYHAKTVIDGGRMSFSNGATVFGRTVQLVNGGVYSLEGDATAFSFDHLVLGDATSAGVLKLDQGDTITITGADGLEVNNLVLDVSHITANGSYHVFTTSGDGTIDPTKLGNVTLRSADPFKTYTLNADGTVTVADRVFAETQWLGTQSSLWSNNDNWSANAPSGTDSKALFGNVANKQVQTSSGASAGVLEFTAQDYVVYGSDAVSVDVAIDNQSSGQVSIASPMAFGEKISLMGSAGASTTLSGSLSGTGVAATKSGSSKVTLSGNNAGLEAAWTIDGGTLAFTREEAFGASVGTMALASGTLAYSSATEDASPNGRLLVSAATDSAAIVDVTSDSTLTFTNIAVASGRLVKKGVGTLKFDLPAGNFNVDDASSARIENPGSFIAFDASGDTPANASTMFTSLAVPEGSLVFEGEGSNVTKVVHRNGFDIGGPYAAAQANAEFVIRNAYFDNDDDRCISVGRLHLSSAFNESWIKVLDGAHLQAKRLRLVCGSGASSLCGLAVTNSSVYLTDWLLIGEGNATRAKVLVGPGCRVRAWNHINVCGLVDVLVDGEGAELAALNTNGRDDRWTWDGILRLEDARGCGVMAFKNGGSLTLAGRIHGNNQNTNGTADWPGLKLLFDGGSLNFLSGGTSIMCKPQYQGAWTEGDGMTISVAEGKTHKFVIPIRGDGGFVKTGAGELEFAGVWAMTSWPQKNVDGVGYFDYQYDETDIPNAGYEGATEVREGILTLAEGSITNTTAVTVGEAGALNLGGNAFEFPSVAGSGVVSNGTLNAVIKVAMDSSSHTGEMPSFSDVVLPANQMFDFDFGDGAMELRVPYTLSRMGVPAGAMSGWKAVSGGRRAYPVFSVDSEGRAVVTLHNPPGTLFIVR